MTTAGTNRLAICALSLLLAGCAGGGGNSAVVDYLIGEGKNSDQPAAASAPAAVSQPGLEPAPVIEDAPQANTAALQPKSSRKFKIRKGTQRVIVVVNDEPITDYDVTQRMRLNRVLGFARGNASAQRREARQELIDDVIKRAEAKRLKIVPRKEQIDAAVKGMAKGSGMSPAKMNATLKKNGITQKQFREYVSTSMAFRWILSRQQKLDIKVSDAEVEHRYKRLESDPRLKPVRVYILQEITLPVEKVSQAMYGQLLQARAIEAQQIVQRYKGCRTARKASSGIFNVKIGRTLKAPERGLPPQMKKVLDRAGPGKIIGPMRAPEGIRLIGYCGRQLIKPPKPSRDVVKNIVQNEKFKTASERAMRDLRRKAFIDERDNG